MICCEESKEHEESGMYFCPLFNNDHIKSFYIEKDEMYTSIKNGVKVVEFISFKADELYFIEAKGSAPVLSEIKKPSKVYKEPRPYNEDNLEIYFQNWSPEDFEHWVKWRIKQDKMKDFFKSLYDKMNHSLNLIAAKELEIKKHLTCTIPDGIKGLISKKRIVFVLIIKSKDNAKKADYYSDILEKIEKEFISLKQVWDIKIRIYTDEQAKKKGFIA